jgi:hypothetical protein
MERYERKNKGGNHKELQDLNPIGFPHKEEKVIGRNVDLDLLSLYPQKDSRSMGGMEEGGQAFKVQQWRRERKEASSPRGKKGAFYRSPHKNSHCRPLSLESPAFGGWRLQAEAKKPSPHLYAERHLEFWRSGDLGRSLRSLGTGVFGLEKYPEVPGQNSGRETAKTHFGPESPTLRGRSLRSWKRQK